MGGKSLDYAKHLDDMKVHKNSLVADLHCDTVLRMLKGEQISQEDSSGNIDIPKLKEGGVDLEVFACFVSTDHPKNDCFNYVNREIDSLEAQVQRNKNDIAICTTAKGAKKVIKSGKIAAVIGIENGVAIENNLDNLEKFHKRGVRILTLTHTSSNDWCTSSGDKNPQFNGLTDFGREVVEKMNELGMIIDLSHASESAFWEVLKITKDPVIASHSCVYTLDPHDRNLTDEQIKALAKNGGMVGINFFNAYLSKEFNEKMGDMFERLEAEMGKVKEEYKDDSLAIQKAYEEFWEKEGKKIKDIKVDVSSVVHDIDYVVKLVGPDCVGLGSDFDGVPYLPEGLKDCS